MYRTISNYYISYLKKVDIFFSNVPPDYGCGHVDCQIKCLCHKCFYRIQNKIFFFLIYSLTVKHLDILFNPLNCFSFFFFVLLICESKTSRSFFETSKIFIHSKHLDVFFFETSKIYNSLHGYTMEWKSTRVLLDAFNPLRCMN